MHTSTTFTNNCEHGSKDVPPPTPINVPDVLPIIFIEEVVKMLNEYVTRMSAQYVPNIH